MTWSAVGVAGFSNLTPFNHGLAAQCNDVSHLRIMGWRTGYVQSRNLQRNRVPFGDLAMSLQDRLG